MKENFKDYLARKAYQCPRQLDHEFDPSNLAAQFIEYFESQERIEVEFVDPAGQVYETLRGRIGVTTGWKPLFILLQQRNSTGSPWTLNDRDRVVKVIPERRSHANRG